jgi:3-polyprenyl-4-hydroxybenzoate decarboxylase
MIGRKLLLIGREARLPIGKDHCLKNMVNVVNKHHAILPHYHRTYKQNVSYTDRPDFRLISRKSSLLITMIGNAGKVISSPVNLP